MTSLDPAQRTRLLHAQLVALVGAKWGSDAPRDSVPFAAGAGLRDHHRAWVLVDEQPDRRVGASVAWGQKLGVERLDLIVAPTDDAGLAAAAVAARRGQVFRDPVGVWRAVGPRLEAVTPAARNATVPVSGAVSAAAEPLKNADGVEIVVEHGELFGEVLGLEVARVVVDADEQEAHLEVGVGRNDRDAFAIMHGDLSVSEALDTVVRAVRAARRPDATSHPLARTASQRWLRNHLVADRYRLPGWTLRAAEGPEPRATVDSTDPAFAVGTDDHGRDVVVACAVGIELETVPIAADGREHLAPHARLVIAVPARDAHTVTRQLVRALRAPADVLAVEGDWRR